MTARCIGLDLNRFVGPLPAADFEAHLHKQFCRSGYVVPNEEPIKLILSLAEEVPYNVQMHAHDVGRASQPEPDQTGETDRESRSGDSSAHS